MGAVGGAIIGVAPRSTEGSQLGAIIGGIAGLLGGMLWLQTMLRATGVSGTVLGSLLGFGCAMASYTAVLIHAAATGLPMQSAFVIAFYLASALVLGAVAGFFNAVIVENFRRASHRARASRVGHS